MQARSLPRALLSAAPPNQSRFHYHPTMPPKTYRLKECNEFSGSADGDEPVLRRVKIIGWESKNNRRYLPESVSLKEYEGKLVNINHPAGPNESRRLEDRFGRLVNAVMEGDGPYADLRYNPAHPMAERVKWWAENDPAALGLSHDAVGQGHTKDGVFVVEKVLSVKSVDLVADPATTKGLFESMDTELQNDAAGGKDDLDSLETHVKNAVAAMCVDAKLSDAEKVKKFKAALKILSEPDEEEEVEEDDEEKDKEVEEDDEEDEGKKGDMEESLKTLSAKYPGVKKLFERVDALQTKLAAKERSELAGRLIAEAKLAAAFVTPVFLAQLSEAKDEEAMKRLVEDRKQIASIQRPQSTGPINRGGKDSAMTNKDFAKQLREGR